MHTHSTDKGWGGEAKKKEKGISKEQISIVSSALLC
jgi:hypothetical protein